MRKIRRVEQRTQIREAFRTEKTPEMIVKLMNVIGRRAGISDVKVVPVPDYYSNRYGQFIGFYVRYNSGDILRFNFLRKGKGDHFYSIDLVSPKTIRPYQTIMLNGYNVVEVVDYVADILTGDYFKYAESYTGSGRRIRERTSMYSVVELWIDSNPNAKATIQNALQRALRGRALNDVLEAIRPDFEAFRDQQHVPASINAQSEFKINCKKYFNQHGIDASVIPTVEVVPGDAVTETPEEPVDPVEKEAYEGLLKNEHFIKFKLLRTYCEEVAKGNKDFRGIYVYGTGGIGKTHWIDKILKPLPNAFSTNEKAPGYTGLVRVLYRHRDEDEILILDDVVTGADMKNENIQWLLKSALGDKHHVKITPANEGEESHFDRKTDSLVLCEEEYNELALEFGGDTYKERRLKESLMTEDMARVDITTTIDRVQDFDFLSTLIFISNYPYIAQAVADRCWSLKMVFTQHQILDLIHEALVSSAPSAPLDTLMTAFDETDLKMTVEEAWQYLDKQVDISETRNMSFRLFHRIVVLVNLGFKSEVLLRQAIKVEIS